MQRVGKSGRLVARPGREVVVVCAGLLVASCGRGPTPVPASAIPHAPVRTLDPALVAANKSMAAGVPIGDSSAPVESRFDVTVVPSPGQPFSVRVAVMPAVPAPLLRVEVSAAEGLTVLLPEAQVTREKVAAGSVVPIDVRVESAAPGARVLYVRATLELPDGPQTRTFAFPILVGAAPPATVPAAVPAPKAPAAGKTSR